MRGWGFSRSCLHPSAFFNTPPPHHLQHISVEASGSLDGAVGAVSVDGVYPLDAHLDLLGRAPGAGRARNPDSRRGSRVIPPPDEGPSTSVAGETGGERDLASAQASPTAATGSALARPSRKSLEERRPSLLNDPEADRRAHVAAKRVTTSNFAGLDLGIQSSGTPSRVCLVVPFGALGVPPIPFLSFFILFVIARDRTRL